MLTVATVQDGGVLASWMQGKIDRKITNRNLGADGSKTPLIRQQDGAVRPLAGEVGRMSRGHAEGEKKGNNR